MSRAAIHAVRNSIFKPASNAAVSAPSLRPGTQAETVFIPISCAFAMAEKQTAAFGKAVEEALGKAKGLLGET